SARAIARACRKSAPRRHLPCGTPVALQRRPRRAIRRSGDDDPREQHMNRILVIDQDRTAMETLGLACLDQGIGVAMADNVCEGVRVLLGESVSLVLVDEHELRFGPRDSATLFERVA